MRRTVGLAAGLGWATACGGAAAGEGSGAGEAGESSTHGADEGSAGSEGTDAGSGVATDAGSSDDGVAGSCGDGVVDDGEDCDDAGASASCNADCTAASCGDGVHNAAAGEGCDDGNAQDGDACSATCTPSVIAIDGPLAQWLDAPQMALAATGDAFVLVYAHIEDASAYDELRYQVIDGDGGLQPKLVLTKEVGAVATVGASTQGDGMLVYLEGPALQYRFFAPGGALDVAGGFAETLTNETWFVPASPPAALGDGRFCVLGGTGGLRCVSGDGLGPAVEIAPPQAMPIISSIDVAHLQPRDGGLVASYVAYVDGHNARELRARAIDSDGAADGPELVLAALGQNGPELPAGAWTDPAGALRVAFARELGLSWHAVGDGGPVVAGAAGEFGEGVRGRVVVDPEGGLAVLWTEMNSEELGPGHTILTCPLRLQRYTSELRPVGAVQTLFDAPTAWCASSFGAATGEAGDLLVTWTRVNTDAYPPVAHIDALLLPAP